MNAEVEVGSENAFSKKAKTLSLCQRYFQALDKIPEILQEITGWQDTHNTNQGRKE